KSDGPLPPNVASESLLASRIREAATEALVKLRPRKVLGYERQERVREFGLLFVGVPMGRDKVGGDEGRRGKGARERCGEHGDFLWKWWRKRSGRFGDRIGVGVRGRRCERRVDRGKLDELVVELALKRERDAKARLERRRPCL